MQLENFCKHEWHAIIFLEILFQWSVKYVPGAMEANLSARSLAETLFNSVGNI